MNAEAITVPAKPRLVADDITSKTAASLLAEQGGRRAVLSPEGGIFATIAGRYSGTPNLEVLLKGHAGDLMRVDRRPREAEHVDKPGLTMGLAVQPEILRTSPASTKAFRAVQSAQLKTAADLAPALAVLEAHGCLRQLDPPAPKRGGGRPPSPGYLVHPEVHRPAATVHPLGARRAS